MSYPINGIFEGVADLLKEHGTSKYTTFNGDEGREENYFKYGGYNYLVVYVNGELSSISRREREVDNGKN